MGISMRPRDETSEHEMNPKVITKARNVQSMLITFFDKYLVGFDP
jgi:hypothetical protein